MSSWFRASALCFGLWFGLSWSPGAGAARTFPQNSVQVKISEINDPYIVADGKTLHLAPGVTIFTPTNTMLVRGALPVGAIVRIQLDFQGDVRRVWLLADDEIVEKPWWKFWQREQPQSAGPNAMTHPHPGLPLEGEGENRATVKPSLGSE